MVEENKMIIVPDTQKENIPEGIQGRLSYTYLHGRLQDDCEYDCYNVIGFEEFGFKQKDEFSSIIVDPDKKGIYPCAYGGQDCSLFLWLCLEGIYKYRGLVVYNDDKEYFQEALEKYNKNVSNI